MRSIRTALVAGALCVLASCDRAAVLTAPRTSVPRGPTGPATADVTTSDIGFVKTCASPTNVGAAYQCSYRILNLVSNTLAITALSDIVHAASGDVSSGNILGSIQLIFSGSVSCVGGSGAGTLASPYVGATSCSLPSGTGITTGAFSHYNVAATDYTLTNHELPDDASLTWNNTCTPTSDGCSTAAQTATAGSSTVVQLLSSTTTTTIHNAAHQGVTAIVRGGTIHDFASVAGPSGSVTPTGSVTIDWFTNATCTGTAASTSSAATLNLSGAVDVTAFNFTPTAAGFYAFQAHYSGDGTYAGSTGACEQLRVVDANIQITPATATNDVGTNHTLTGHVNINDGTGSVNAPDGVVISFSIASGPGSFVGPSQCTTSAGTGSCAVVITSSTTGTTTIGASTTLSVSGLTITRETDGTGSNSTTAQKTWKLPNPIVTVTKACPNGKQSVDDRFAVVLNGTATGDVLDCGQSVNVALQPSTAFNFTEQASGTTTNLANYSATYSGCQGNGLAAGATSTCTITNTLRPPHSTALSAGYWKNHSAEAGALLPVSLGSYLVQDFAAATAVFNAMDCGASKDLGVIGCLAGQLLAAKLNVKNGSSNCINTLIGQADGILVTAGYQGPGQPLSTPLTLAQRQATERLATKLDRYNSGKGC